MRFGTDQPTIGTSSTTSRDRDINGEGHRPHQVDADPPTGTAALSYRVVLAPAYTGAVEIDGERYRFWVDGTTGIATAEVSGSLWAIPWMLLSIPLILGGVFATAIGALLLALLTGWAITEPFD